MQGVQSVTVGLTTQSVVCVWLTLVVGGVMKVPTVWLGQLVVPTPSTVSLLTGPMALVPAEKLTSHHSSYLPFLLDILAIVLMLRKAIRYIHQKLVTYQSV